MFDRIDLWERRLGRIARAVALIGLAGLVLIAGLTVADVLGRWLFHMPLNGARDFSQVSIVVVVAACFPAAVIDRQHITIRFLGEWLGPRAAVWLDAFGAAVLFLVLAVVAWQFVVYTGELIRENQHTWIIRLQYYPWWIVGTALFAITAILQLLIVVVQIVRAICGQSARDDAERIRGLEG